MHAVVRQQYREVKRSFINVREFSLTPQFDRFVVSPDIWLFEDQGKKSKRFKKFMSALVLTDEQVVRSTDGCRTSRAPTHKGKKPGQVKRKQCAKTTSTQ
ncbi:hypothetical protein V1264_021172 [Littorina saxatilis]|uniref:Uncharacterized protein n=1 Tax=Littorina saxatilis TaxID=31220 RepID=A0AAN9BCK4_9CAEN